MTSKAFKPVLPALMLPFLALAAPAQQLTGTAHPDDSAIQADHYVKPSHEKSAAPAPAYQDSYPATGRASEPVLLTREPTAASASSARGEKTATGLNTDGRPDTPAPVQTAELAPAEPAPDTTDGSIVLSVPTRPHELNRGALLHARLRETLNTETTAEGALFTAELLANAGHDGEVLLPAGSLIRGHVTSVHGGRRIAGGAAMHLRPETISLPDGTLYRLEAQLTDLNSTQDLRVNDEGTVVLRSNPKAAAAVVGGVTAAAAVTGAVVGGGVGAAVGAIAGAGIATAVYLKREIQERLPSGTDVIFALEQPLTLAPR